MLVHIFFRECRSNDISGGEFLEVNENFGGLVMYLELGV